MPDKEFFTQEERESVLEAINSLSNVDLVIFDRDTGKILPGKISLTDRETFFAKAKVWRVVETIITELFLEQLINKKLVFKKDGESYIVMPLKPKSKPEEEEKE